MKKKLFSLLLVLSVTLFTACIQLHVDEIKFNFDTTSYTQDALNIRKNYTTQVNIPEWQSGETDFKDSPAAYVGNRKIIVLAKFSANRDRDFTVYTKGGPFRLKKTKITIVNGTSSWVKLESTILPHQVRLADVVWRWKRKIWWIFSKGFDKSYHRFYIVVDQPHEPWQQTPYPNDQNPWAEALDYACLWANGETTVEGIAAKITENINSGPYAYDQAGGATHYGTYNPRRYDLTAFLDRWNGGYGNGAVVNCSDCGMSVTTFANLLGHELWSSRMNFDFPLNPIVAVGYTTCACPDWGCGFSYHEVAWTGNASASDLVNDACLKVDGDSDPEHTPCDPLLPVNMIFVDYRARLVPASSLASCQAQQGTKVRPPLY